MRSDALILIAVVMVTVVSGNDVIKERCDVSKMAAGGDRAVPRLRGTWYIMRVTPLPAPLADLKALKVTIRRGVQHQGKTAVEFLMNQEHTGKVCQKFNIRCVLEGNTCTALNFPRKDTLVATDYSSVAAVYSEVTVHRKMYPIFTILARDPNSPVDLSSVKSQLGRVCDDTVADPESDFYGAKFSYDNFPCDNGAAN